MSAVAGCTSARIVSIHASGGEATMLAAIMAVRHWSFNPRLRGGGDRSYAAPCAHAAVSIHASGGEATERALWTVCSMADVSIHASGGEATLAHQAFETVTNVSIHASGGEATAGGNNCRRHRVSIHASGGEATAKYGGKSSSIPISSHHYKKLLHFKPWMGK